MVLLTALLLLSGAGALLYSYLRGRSGRRALWRSALTIGAAAGVARAGLAAFGWYTVEHTGGPLQIPGYALTMLALPEAAFLPRRRAVLPAPPEFYVALCAAIILGTMIAVGVVALIAGRHHEQ